MTHRDQIISKNRLGKGKTTSSQHPRRQTPLRASELVAFIGTTDPARAKAFYRDTLGLILYGEDQFALVFDAHGTPLRISIVPEVAAAGYTVLGWRVPDIVATVSELETTGVKFERYPGLRQDKLGIWKSPTGAHVAWFKDPDGNILSITQSY